MDVEKVFDPHIGEVVVAVEKVHKKYPSCDATTRVAKCVYCEKVKDKAVMLCIGQNHHEKGSLRYVWRCKEQSSKDGKVRAEGCEAGSKSWLKHYAHKTPFGKLWNYNLDTGKAIKHSDEETVAVGRQIVQKVQDKVDTALAKALSKIKEDRVKSNRGKFIAEFAQRKKKVAQDLLNALKKGAEKAGGKNVRVELKTKLERRSVVVARSEDGDAKLRSGGVVPRWKRKGRDARVRR